jgi:hypothetical protein
VSVEDKLKQGVKEIVELLVNQEYIKLQNTDKIGVLTANEVEQAILDYGEKLTIPPDDAFNEMDIFKLDNPQKFVEEYSIDFELWTNKSRSDLTLSCDATVDEQGNVNVTLYSIRVL